MAKKKPAPSTAAPKGRQKAVSVKKIVAEIERTVAKLEAARATTVQARGAAAADADPQSYALDRAIMTLRAAGDVAKGICVPGFDIPI